MPLNAQDLWVVLKAQDMATRALNAYSRSVRKAGTDTRIAYNDAAIASVRQQIAQRNLAQRYNETAIATEQLNRQQLVAYKNANKFVLSPQGKRAIEDQIYLIDKQIDQYKRNGIALNQQIALLDAHRNKLLADKKAYEQALDSENERLRIHAQRLEQASARYKAFAQSAYAASFAITAVGVVGVKSISGAIKAAADYETQVRKTFTQVDKGQASLKQLGDVGIAIATKIGIKFEDVQNSLYDVFSSMDVNLTQATTYVTAFAKAAVAGQTNIDNVSRGTIAILNSFKLSAGDINHILDLQFKFIQKGVGDYDEWVTKLGQVAPSAIRAGQSLETMMAALAEASRMSGVASKASTAVARALDVISHPKAVAAMKALGINALDASGNLRPLADVLTDIKARLDKIPNRNDRLAAFLDIIKGAGGTIEARRFLTNMIMEEGTLDDFKSILNDTANAAGSLNQAYGIMADNTQTKTQLLKNRFHALYIEVGKLLLPYFNKLLDIGNAVVNWINNLSPKTKEIAAKLFAWGSAIALVVGPIIGLLGIIGSISGALAMLGISFGEVIIIIAGLAIAIAGYGAAIKKAWDSSQEFRTMLIEVKNTVVDVYNMFRKFAKGVAESFNEKLKPALKDLWTVLEANVIPMFQHLAETYENSVKKNLADLLDKLKSVVDFGFKYLAAAIENWLIPAINELTTFYYKHQDAIDLIIKTMITVQKWMLIIAGAAVIGLLIGAVIAAIGAFRLIVYVLEFCVGSFKGLILIIKAAIDWIVACYKAFWEALKAIWDDVNKYLGWVADKFKSLKDSVLGKINELKDQLYTAGQDLIHGLAEGIKSKVDAFLGFVSGIWDNIPSGFKKVLGIGSPSKVFKQFGKDTIQGYINGVKDMSNPLNRSVMEISDKIASGQYNQASSNGRYGYAGYAGYSNQTGSGANIVINVTTQELRPQANAAKLGYLLAGRI